MNRPFTVVAKIENRYTGNGILKDAGINKKVEIKVKVEIKNA